MIHILDINCGLIYPFILIIVALRFILELISRRNCLKINLF